MMTSRLRVQKAVSHEVTDSIPSTLYLDKGLEDRVKSPFPNDTIRILWEIEARQCAEGGFIDPFGVRWESNNASSCFVDPPMADPDVRQIPRIRLLPDGEVDRIRSIRAQNPDAFIYYQFTMTFGERLWALRGFENYLVDLIENPIFVHEALDILLEMHMKALDTILTLPIDGVTFGDDFGTQRGLMIRPDDFRTFFKPRLARLYDRVRRAGLIVGAHSCGDNTAIMGDYIDIGLQVFHPLQPECMDIKQIKKNYGKDLTFRGGIGVQGSVVHGRPAEVRHDVLEAARILAEGGGYLLEPCKPLPPETPIDNVHAFIDAMADARSYRFI